MCVSEMYEFDSYIRTLMVTARRGKRVERFADSAWHDERSRAPGRFSEPLNYTRDPTANISRAHKLAILFRRDGCVVRVDAES